MDPRHILMALGVQYLKERGHMLITRQTLLEYLQQWKDSELVVIEHHNSNMTLSLKNYPET